jgi:hypothetical protein
MRRKCSLNSAGRHVSFCTFWTWSDVGLEFVMQWLKSGHRIRSRPPAPSSLESSRANPQCIAMQRALQRVRLVPRRPHPHVTLFLRRQDQRHGLGMNRLNDRVRRRRLKPVDEMGTRSGFDLVPRSPLNSVQMPAKTKSGRSRTRNTTSGSAPVKIRPRKIRVSNTVVVATPARSGKGAPESTVHASGPILL